MHFAPLDAHLASNKFLVGNAFSVTDIFAGFATKLGAPDWRPSGRL